MARRAAEFGVNIPCEISVDMKAVKARKDRISRVSREGVENWLRNLEGCTVYQGHARFCEPRTVQVDSKCLTAEKIFINVGGRPFVPAIPGLDDVGYLTSSSMMEVDFLPPHLIVLGGSYIGLEFAQIFRRFGSEVSVVELAPRLLAREDEDVSVAVADILQKEDIDIHVNSKVTRVLRQGNDIAVEIDSDGSRSQVLGSHLLMAIGRRPNTDDLGLEAAGIAVDDRGFIEVDNGLRTNVEGIWALGDCNGRGAFTHTSYNDFEIVAANILDCQSRSVSDRIPAYALYTDPPLGRVGMTETEVRRSGRAAMVGTLEMKRVGRAYERSETLGFMKILVDKTSERILGASFLGLSGDEVAHSILDLMYANAPYTVLQRAVHIHPTVSEYVPVMIGNLKDLQ
jgi:pyruvate/2-oxoglutarate dehydrogenase complex dihydrolipoamide dehydrogenase (E3) component